MQLKDKVELWWRRFHARRDVYGIIRTKTDLEAKKPKKTVFPSFVPKYRDEEARKGKTFSDPAELYEPLSKHQIEEHLEGTLELMIYMPRTDGTTKFAAADFDFQHGFEEVQRVSRALTHHKIPHGIARSTTKGHHIYLFFNELIQSYYITNYFRYVYTQLGYMERLNDENYRTPKNDKWTNPEIFPKQISIADAKNTGGGIKPAMNGMGVNKDRCCWVDINDNIIGGVATSDAQWEHFEQIPDINAEEFVNFLTQELKLHIEEDLKLSVTQGVSKDYGRSLPYEPPTDGDFMLVVSGCPALREMWTGSISDLNQDKRICLLAMALRCKNGVDLIREKFGNTERTEKEIQYAIDSNQHPWTCSTMQRKGICLKGKHPRQASGFSKNQNGEIITDMCFPKVAPREIINGDLKINPHNLPESDWPSPSPVRLKNPFVQTDITTIKTEILSISKDDENLEEKLEVVFKKIVSLKDSKSRKEAEEFLKSKKLTNATTIKSIKKQIADEKKNKTEEINSISDGFRTSNGIQYSTNVGDGYSIVRVGTEGENEFIPLSNFEIEFDEDRKSYPVIGESERWFIGSIRCKGIIHPFKITAKDWSNSNKLAESIFNAVGTDADFDPANTKFIRAAANLFGCEHKKVVRAYEDYGFDSYNSPQVYRTTTGNVTEQGFVDKEDTNTIVDLSRVPFARHLGLKDLSRSELADAASVLKSILKMQEPVMTYTTVAHSLQAVIHNIYIPMPDAPILWLTGTTGVGKSQMGTVAQGFHGNFGNKKLTVNSTVRSMDQYTMVFKDSLLYLDDYKAHLTPEKVITPLIQKIYDRSERARLNTNLKHSDTITSRGLVMFTGEDIPTGEASVIARMIYINSDNKLEGTTEEMENLRTIHRYLPLLPGLTAKFIQYMLQTYPDPLVVHEKFISLQSTLSADLPSIAQGKKLNNAPRIVNNLAANFLTWELFLEFLLEEGLMAHEDVSNMRETHRLNILQLRMDILNRCYEEQASNIFLGLIGQLLLSGKYGIEGLTNIDGSTTIIGYHAGPKKKEIFLYPDECYKAVQRSVRDSGGLFTHTKEAIGKQLLEDGYLIANEKGTTMVRKTHHGSRTYVWALDGIKAGIGVTLAEVGTEDSTINVDSEEGHKAKMEREFPSIPLHKL